MHQFIYEKTFELHGSLTERSLPVNQVIQIEEMYDNKIMEQQGIIIRKTRRAVIQSLESTIKGNLEINIPPIVVLAEPIEEYEELFINYLNENNDEGFTQISLQKIREELFKLKKEGFYLTYNGNTRLYTNKKIGTQIIQALVVHNDEEFSCIPTEEQSSFYQNKGYLFTFFALLKCTLVKRIQNEAHEKFQKFIRKPSIPSPEMHSTM